jgi:NADPH-dependent ferric siderophore reductase
LPAASDYYEIVQFPLVFRRVAVKSVERVTPRLARITVTGDELAGFQTLSPIDHFKLMIPEPGEESPAMPVLTESGWTYPEGIKKPTMRDYTPRRYDEETNELCFDVVLHGDSPASTWAANAMPGRVVGIAGPRGSARLVKPHDWYLLFGDETALPAIARILEEFPAGTPITAFVEVHDAGEIQPLGGDVFWCDRRGEPSGTGDHLLKAARSCSIPDGTGLVLIGGEAGMVTKLRRHFANERGFPKDFIVASGHWKLNVADWDHHEELEE